MSKKEKKENNNSKDGNREVIEFVCKIAKSGKRRIINIPADVREEVNDDYVYWKCYLFPVRFGEFEK